MLNNEENKQIKTLATEVKELKEMLRKQGIQNKKMTYVMLMNLYLIVAIMAYFLVIE